MTRSTAHRQRRRIDPKWKSWHEALRTLRRTRRTIAKSYSPHGPKWKHKMLLHYDGKIRELLKEQPPKYLE
ncbi:MAG: hypothetical protein ACE5OQ_14915 [Woeseia sp.]